MTHFLGLGLPYRVKARTITSVTVSPRRAASLRAAFHTSSATRTDRMGVLGWFGIPDSVPLRLQGFKKPHRTPVVRQQRNARSGALIADPVDVLVAHNSVTHGLAPVQHQGKGCRPC